MERTVSQWRCWPTIIYHETAEHQHMLESEPDTYGLLSSAQQCERLAKQYELPFVFEHFITFTRVSATRLEAVIWDPCGDNKLPQYDILSSFNFPKTRHITRTTVIGVTKNKHHFKLREGQNGFISAGCEGIPLGCIPYTKVYLIIDTLPNDDQFFASIMCRVLPPKGREWLLRRPHVHADGIHFFDGTIHMHGASCCNYDCVIT